MMGFLRSVLTIAAAAVSLCGCSYSYLAEAPPFEFAANAGIESENGTFFGLFPQGAGNGTGDQGTLNYELVRAGLPTSPMIPSPQAELCDTYVLLVGGARPEPMYLPGTIGEDHAFIIMPRILNYEDNGAWMFELAVQCAHFKLGQVPDGGPNKVFGAREQRNADIYACRMVADNYDRRYAQWMMAAWMEETPARAANLQRC